MRGVGFDFDHTLGLDNKLERSALLEILSSEILQDGLTLESCGDLIDETLQCYRSGEEELDSALVDLFARTLDPEDYDPAELIFRFKQCALDLAPKFIDPMPGARELLAQLTRAGIRTAILTNGWNPLQQAKASLLGYTGPVLVSDDMRIRKPNRQAFAMLAQTLELPPSDVVFVGDSPAVDIAGAINAGMRAIWLDCENHGYDPALPQPTWTVKELSQIAGLLLSPAQTR